MIDAKILPDRAHYCLSHKGIAEEVAVLTKSAIKNRYVDLISATLESKPSIKIEDPDFCRRYTARLIEGVKVSESPKWLKESLEAIGQRSINSIVDVSNYVMYDIGQPLHAFDADKIRGSIVVRSAKSGEKITLLDGREISLTVEDHVIADDLGALVIAGAKGGKRAEVTAETKRIMIESANFEPTAVRKTSTKYDIRSDSSKRFENEITPELAIHGMNNISALIRELIPEAKFGPIVDEYPVKAKQTVITFDPDYIEERLGIKVPLDEVKDMLVRIGISVDSAAPDVRHPEAKWNLFVPVERLDLIIPEDVVEEIGRIFGYEHIKGILPPPIEKQIKILAIYYLSEKIKNILIGLGFSEVSLYTLVANGDIEAAKPLARDKAFARKNLKDGMFDALQKNALNADLLELDSIKIFEIGHVFNNEGEETHLVLGAAQIKKVKGVKSENIILAAIESLRAEIGDAFQNTIEKNGNNAVVEINLTRLSESIKIPSDSNYSDLRFGRASENRYSKISAYPFIVRDIAIFVPESIQSETVLDVVVKAIDAKGSKELLARHSLFDVFKKDEKTSFAFRMVFQSMERTLTDEEISSVMQSINEEVKKKGWEVR